jgi:DNA-binding NtrC family response regulator
MPKSVLIVEDDKQSRAECEQDLKDVGYLVVSAGDRDNALRAIRALSTICKKTRVEVCQ